MISGEILGGLVSEEKYEDSQKQKQKYIWSASGEVSSLYYPLGTQSQKSEIFYFSNAKARSYHFEVVDFDQENCSGRVEFSSNKNDFRTIEACDENIEEINLNGNKIKVQFSSGFDSKGRGLKLTFTTNWVI